MSINNDELKNENMAKSAFTNNNQGMDPNNENYKLNQRNKSQDELDPAENEKEEEKSCFKSITSILDTRLVSPFALTVFTIIGILINVIVFVSSLIYSSIDMNPKTPYFYELMTNWASGPIFNITDPTSITGNTDWHNIDWDNLTTTAWEGKKFKINYIDTNYNLTLHISDKKDGKKCGVDSIGNELYFNNTDKCPINDIIIDSSNTPPNTQYNYETIPLDNGKYLHYTNEKTNGTIIVQFVIKGEKDVCENNIFDTINDICYYLDNCYANSSLYNISDCYQMGLYTKLDSMKLENFIQDNGLTGVTQDYYNNNDEVSLNVRGWVGIDTDYLKYLNRTVDYYEDVEVEYKWQLLMTIVSIVKTVFFTLNNHFEWIRPWNMILLLVNVVITVVIFSIEITKKQEVVKAVRAYYYLYNYIYKNLVEDYPPLEKKTFVEFYYIVLEVGYIVKLVSEICSWIDWYKFCDKCTCNCDKCQDRYCIKCKGDKCIIHGVNCSCDCEKCKKNDCFLCEGSGSRELKNVFLKKRCDIYLKFSVNGWKSYKIITGALYVFLIFMVVYVCAFIFLDDQLSFV